MFASLGELECHTERITFLCSACLEVHQVFSNIQQSISLEDRKLGPKLRLPVRLPQLDYPFRNSKQARCDYASLCIRQCTSPQAILQHPENKSSEDEQVSKSALFGIMLKQEIISGLGKK